MLAVARHCCQAAAGPYQWGHEAHLGFDNEWIMKSISLKGVAIGAVLDIVLTNIVTLPLMIYIMASLNSAGVPSDKVSGALMEALYGSTLYFSLAWLLGGSCSVLGGYVSARIAKHDEVLNGTLASILCLAFSVYALIGGTTGGQLWRHVVFLPLSPALAAFGGYLRLQQKTRHSA
jgi:hypothetical protein